MTCECCNTARLSPAYRIFCPTCLHCGARMIQVIGLLPITRQEVSTRRRKVLTDWMAHGHPEQVLRELAGMDMPALQPLELEGASGLSNYRAGASGGVTGPARNTASARPSRLRRR